MDDGPGAAVNATNNREKSNNNRAMSPSETTAATPSDVMMMEATAKLNLMQRNLAQVAARAAAAAAAAAHSQSRLSFSVDSLLGGGHGRRQKEQSEPKGSDTYRTPVQWNYLCCNAAKSAKRIEPLKAKFF